ncbi:MAG: hypothetical protein P1U88_06210 [Thalassobaculaceae bacterium]|nr:hypothetical protein [Thalassobaculaceae bacterium]
MEPSADVDKAIARCSGTFSTLTLFETHLSIDRSQFICDVHEVVFRSHPIRKSRIELSEITDLGLTASMALPPLFVIRFAGCSQLTGSILHDAILENVHMLSFIDNRPFYALYHELECMISARRRPADPETVSAGRRPFRSFP